ncbi:MAG: class II glutamine amidotransferase [Thermoprotei archaeon]|nr:MAG: class II glutamine amidotransferase [Thermoprotei archaeon]
MCRLLGLYANKPVDIYFSFYETPVKSFEKQSQDNPDGWGVAWLTSQGWNIFKEPLALYESPRARRIIKKIVRGKIIVSHVRLPSYGGPKLENTHPWLYKGWVFAHNGTINKHRLLKLLEEDYKKDLEGNTDSERFFHLIVQEADKTGDPVEGIKSAVNKIIENNIFFTSLNFIASDGEKLYALRYARINQNYYTLYYLKRPHKELELRKLSNETRQLISMKLASGEKAVIIASETMSDEPHWKQIPNKHLLTINKNLTTKLTPSN